MENSYPVLVCADCLSAMENMKKKSIDAVIADLPYGTTHCKWDEVIPLDELWKAYQKVCKDTAPIVLFASQPFTSRLISSNFKMFRFCWYWEKEKGTGFLNAKRQPLRAIEEICVFYKKPPVYNPQMVPLDKPYRHTLPNTHSDIHNHGVKSIDAADPKRQYVTYTHSYPKNILRFPRDKANKSLIPSQKPLALVEHLVKTHTNPGDVVLDNVMGSGTTGVACKKLNRKFIGIELKADHFDIAKNRIESTPAP